MSRSKRFPQSMKDIRGKFPKGTTVQARFITEKGTVIEWEGQAGDEFQRFYDAVLGKPVKAKSA